MAVLERGAGLPALVDDQLHVGGAARSGRASARARPPTAAPSSPSSSWPSEVPCRGELTITSWNPVADRRAKRSGSRPRERGAQRVAGGGEAPRRPRRRPRRSALVLPALRQRRVEVGDRPHPPARRVRLAAARAGPPRSRAGCGPRAPRRRAVLGRARRSARAAPLKSKGRSARAGARIVRRPVSWSRRISGCRLLRQPLERLPHPHVLDPASRNVSPSARSRARRRRPRLGAGRSAPSPRAPCSRASASAPASSSPRRPCSRTRRSTTIRSSLQLASLRISQAAGRDHAGLVEGDDLDGLLVEVVELLSGVDALLVDEDLDAQVHRSLDLRRVACGAHRDGQTAVQRHRRSRGRSAV